MVTVLKVIRALWGMESGRVCRRCKEPVGAGDAFGISEGVCGPCRAPAHG
jgi:hypothetical protein